MNVLLIRPNCLSTFLQFILIHRRLNYVTIYYNGKGSVMNFEQNLPSKCPANAQMLLWSIILLLATGFPFWFLDILKKKYWNVQLFRRSYVISPVHPSVRTITTNLVSGFWWNCQWLLFFNWFPEIFSGGPMRSVLSVCPDDNGKTNERIFMKFGI